MKTGRAEASVAMAREPPDLQGAYLQGGGEPRQLCAQLVSVRVEGCERNLGHTKLARLGAR